MRLLSETKKAPEVERVTARDKNRPVLAAAYLNVERGTLEATDSYKAVVVPVDVEEGDVSGPIPAEALKAQRKASKREPASLAAGAEVRVESPDGSQTWPREAVGQFPNLRQVTPEQFSRFRIGLNPTFLLDLAKALGDPDSVVLEFTLQGDKVEGDDTGAFPAAHRPLRVTVKNGGESFGLLMPIRGAA